MTLAIPVTRLQFLLHCLLIREIRVLDVAAFIGEGIDAIGVLAPIGVPTMVAVLDSPLAYVPEYLTGFTRNLALTLAIRTCRHSLITTSLFTVYDYL